MLDAIDLGIANDGQRAGHEQAAQITLFCGPDVRFGSRLCKNALGMFVGGVSRDPGGVVRLGAANSAELVRANAYWLLEAKNSGLLRPVRPVSCVDCLHQSANA